MPIEDQWRGVAQPGTFASAWSLLEFRAHDRMTELLGRAPWIEARLRQASTSGSRTSKRVAA
jgi:hypothetical protein